MTIMEAKQYKELEARVTGARYLLDPLANLIAPLIDLRAMIGAAGLMPLSITAAALDHPFLRRALDAVSDGTEPAEIAAMGLEEAARQSANGEKERVLFLAFACILLQTSTPDLRGELELFLRRKAGLRSLANLLEAVYLPHQVLRRDGQDLTLEKVLELGSSHDALGWCLAGLKSQELENLDTACDTSRRVRETCLRLHPFAASFQDFLSSPEVDRMEPSDLLGVLRFGFLAGADMVAAFHALSSAHQAGRAGPFSTFLLGMLHLYHLEDIPYEPVLSFRCILESAKGGLPIASVWAAAFCESRRPPAFPGTAVPREVSGGEVFSQGEIDHLLDAISIEGPTEPPPAWYKPDLAERFRLAAGFCWLGTGLESRARRSLEAGETKTVWDCLRRGAVFQEGWALSAVAGAWAGIARGVASTCPGSVAALRSFTVTQAAARVIVALFAANSPDEEFLPGLAERLETGKDLPRDPALAAAIRKELGKTRAETTLDGSLDQAEINQLLGKVAGGES